MGTLGGEKVNQSHILNLHSQKPIHYTCILTTNRQAIKLINPIFDGWNYKFATYKTLKPLCNFWMFQLGGRIRISRRNESEFEAKW